MNAKSLFTALMTGAVALQLGACSEGTPDPSNLTPGENDVATLLHLTPVGGAVDVDPNAPVVLEFDHPVSPHMADYALLHEGDLDGPQVAGSWTQSEDGTAMTFTPDEPLKPATEYVVHLGGTMTDVHGHGVDLENHGPGMGGEWAWEEMFDHMGAGMGHGPGMDGSFDPPPHMGEDWRHDNGSYGMTFTFTTAG